MGGHELSPVPRRRGTLRPHPHFSLREQRETVHAPFQYTPLPDKVFSGRLPLLWWKHPGWKEQHREASAKEAIIINMAALVTNGVTVMGSIYVGLNFPSNPLEAAAEVTGLVGSAATEIYLARRAARTITR